MYLNRLIGTWKLESYELRSTDRVVFPFGEDPIGYIMYNSDGYMSVTFMRSERKKFVSADLEGGTAEEKVSAHDTYFSYCGRYEVFEDRILHHIEVSLYPNWIGVKQERLYKFEEDELMLSTPPLVIDGKQQTARLVWKKVRSARE